MQGEGETRPSEVSTDKVADDAPVPVPAPSDAAVIRSQMMHTLIGVDGGGVLGAPGELSGGLGGGAPERIDSAAVFGEDEARRQEQPPPSFPTPSFLALPVPPALAPVVPRQHASTAFLVIVAFVSLVADLATKGWAKARLDGYDAAAHSLRKIEVWKDHVDLIFARNPGGAWSFLRSLPDSLRRPFFLVVSAAAIVFIVSIYRRVYRDQTSMKWGLPLALGGAMGNLADRIRYGWVVDFIDTSVKWGGRDHHWPTFNVADIAIVLGVGLMAIDMLRSRGLSVPDMTPSSRRPTDLPSASPSA